MRLLVAVDGSRAGEEALTLAWAVAERLGGEVHLALLSPRQRGWDQAPSPGWARCRLMEAASRLTHPGCPVVVHELKGWAGAEICRCAREAVLLLAVLLYTSLRG